MTTKSKATGKLTITIEATFEAEVGDSGTEFIAIDATANNDLRCSFDPKVMMSAEHGTLFNMVCVDAVLKYVSKYQAEKLAKHSLQPGVVIIDAKLPDGSNVH